MLLTALAGIFMFVVVVVVHEGGHAFMAKLCGVGLSEFSIGMGKPKIKLFQTKNFPINFRFILLGGFVRLKTKADKSTHETNGKFYEDAKLWQKVAILISGILANLIFAVLLRIAIFIFCPSGAEFSFLSLNVSLIPAPVWYLIPFYAVKSVWFLFYNWFIAMTIGFIVAMPTIAANVVTAPAIPNAGVIGTVGLGGAIHSGFWSYVGMIFYFSVLVAAMNLIPFYPLDGGNIFLEAMKSFIKKLFGEGKILKWADAIYKCFGFAILLILLLIVLKSDIRDIITFFWK